MIVASQNITAFSLLSVYVLFSPFSVSYPSPPHSSTSPVGQLSHDKVRKCVSHDLAPRVSLNPYLHFPYFKTVYIYIYIKARSRCYSRELHFRAGGRTSSRHVFFLAVIVFHHCFWNGCHHTGANVDASHIKIFLNFVICIFIVV